MDGRIHTGFIAEQFDQEQAVNLSNLVIYDPIMAVDEETGESYDTGELDPMSINYIEIVPYAVRGLQELLARIELLEARVLEGA